MSHHTRASEYAAGSKGKGKAPAYYASPILRTVEHEGAQSSSTADKAELARLRRVRVRVDADSDRRRNTGEDVVHSSK